MNDINAHLTNFWRALQRDPEAVARHADYPCSELDLHARGDWLFYRPGVEEWIEKLRADPDFYDAKSAGWWCWGMSCWIGDNWGRRNCRSLPHLGNAGQGINRKLPHLGDAGKGDPDAPPFETSSTSAIIAYFAQLAERLRRVRICCGDWQRVLGPSPTFKLGITGIFLDPPYAIEDRDSVYSEHDSFTVAHDVRAWAIVNGDNPLLRIALAGYDEHDMPRGWDCVAWKAHGGYSCERKKGKNDNNARETLWFSPHCLPATQTDMLSALFEEAAL